MSEHIMDELIDEIHQLSHAHYRGDNMANDVAKAIRRHLSGKVVLDADEVVVLPEGAGPEAGDVVTSLGLRFYRINKINDGAWFDIAGNYGEIKEAKIILRNGKPAITRKEV